MFPGDINHSVKGFWREGTECHWSEAGPHLGGSRQAPRDSLRHQRITWVISFLPPPGQILRLGLEQAAWGEYDLPGSVTLNQPHNQESPEGLSDNPKVLILQPEILIGSLV